MISSMSRAACTARRKFDVVRRRLRVVELDHLESEGQNFVDDVALVALEPFGRRAVHGFEKLHLAGFEGGVACAGFRHEPEGHGVEEHFLLAGEAIAARGIRDWARSRRTARS